jgi:hypothetical protein
MKRALIISLLLVSIILISGINGCQITKDNVSVIVASIKDKYNSINDLEIKSTTYVDNSLNYTTTVYIKKPDKIVSIENNEGKISYFCNGNKEGMFRSNDGWIPPMEDELEIRDYANIVNIARSFFGLGGWCSNKIDEIIGITEIEGALDAITNYHYNASISEEMLDGKSVIKIAGYGEPIYYFDASSYLLTRVDRINSYALGLDKRRNVTTVMDYKVNQGISDNLFKNITIPENTFVCNTQFINVNWEVCNLPIVINSACLDSDSRDEYTKGIQTTVITILRNTTKEGEKTFTKTQYYEDKCLNDSTLNEVYCTWDAKPNEIVTSPKSPAAAGPQGYIYLGGNSIITECQKGCRDGACIQ